MTLRKLGLLLAGLLLLAALVVTILAAGSDAHAYGEIRLEIIKSLLELAVVVVIGGVVAALFKAVDSTRESAAKSREESSRQAQLRAQIQEEYLKRLGHQYRLVKASRRALRAVGLTTKHQPPTELTAHQCTVLEEEMKKINSAQLEIEGMKIESERLPVFMAVKEVAVWLHTMEDYLRKLLAEYEKWMPHMRAGMAVNLGTLEKLREFTGSTRAEGMTFLSYFAVPYEQFVQQVSRSIARAA